MNTEHFGICHVFVFWFFFNSSGRTKEVNVIDV